MNVYGWLIFAGCAGISYVAFVGDWQPKSDGAQGLLGLMGLLSLGMLGLIGLMLLPELFNGPSGSDEYGCVNPRAC